MVGSTVSVVCSSRSCRSLQQLWLVGSSSCCACSGSSCRSYARPVAVARSTQVIGKSPVVAVDNRLAKQSSRSSSIWSLQLRYLWLKAVAIGRSKLQYLWLVGSSICRPEIPVSVTRSFSIRHFQAPAVCCSQYLQLLAAPVSVACTTRLQYAVARPPVCPVVAVAL